jgi:hypothetical protein
MIPGDASTVTLANSPLADVNESRSTAGIRDVRIGCACA